MLVAGAILLALLTLAWVIYRSPRAGYLATSHPTPPPSASPVPNDKLVMVAGPDFNEVTQAAADFMNLYPDTFLKLLAVEEGLTAVVFPFDLSSDTFYFLVNYLPYPIDRTYSRPAWVRGWATLPVHTHGHQKAPAEAVMAFVPNIDEEHDCVLIVVASGPAYKIRFTDMRPVALGSPVAEKYQPPLFSLEKLQQFEPEPASQCKHNAS